MNRPIDLQTPLRDALERYVRAEETAAAICDTLGVTREMVSDLHAERCGNDCHGQPYYCPVCSAADALSTLLEVAGR